MDDTTLTLSQRADALEHRLIDELDPRPARSMLYMSGEIDPRFPPPGSGFDTDFGGKHLLMGADPRLPNLPDQPTLLDFFALRAPPITHLLQSATKALHAGCNETAVLACLLHDIAPAMFIRADHGYWGAQLVEPYVDEEVAWAIRAHQVLRFFPDPAYGYEYPALYVEAFGPDYEPEPYVKRAYEKYRNHRFYGTARLITVNDIYAWDPTMVVNLDDFRDIIARGFRQPEEGLGWDDTPASHLWRTINWPTRFL
jgi:hypothetical protein